MASSGLFNGFFYELDDDGELQPTREKVPWTDWGEIYRLYHLGVDLGLQTDAERPPGEVS